MSTKLRPYSSARRAPRSGSGPPCSSRSTTSRKNSSKPAGLFFRDVVDLLEQGDPDPERGARLAEEYGLSFVDTPWLSDVVSRFDLRS